MMIRRLVSRLFPGTAATARPGAQGNRGIENPLNDHPQLWWLTDVPLFLDERSVDRLHGAIVQPEYVLLQSQETGQRRNAETGSSETEGGAEASIPAFLKLGLKAKNTEAVSREVTQSRQLTKQFVYTAERRLQEVLVAYRERQPERVLFDQPDGSGLTSLEGKPVTWKEAEALLDQSGPRPLVFLDLAPEAAILPMAGETTLGSTVRLFEPLIARLGTAEAPIPPFPGDKDPDRAAMKDAHWNALIAAYDNRVALEVVEEGFGGGQRIEWIDYRIKLGSRPKPIHIHFSPRGQVPTGAFAYNFVRRGFKVGLRIVAQLRKGCDMRALALYER